MKRIISVLAILALLLVMLPSASRAAADPDSITTPYIVLMDAETGAVLFEKNAYTQTYPASTTKIMTAILAIENCEDVNEIVTVGDVVESKGSLMNIVRGEQIRLIDLLYGMMLKSGNDAAKAIAEHVSGSEEAFAVFMNQKAAELGMSSTHFVKPNGLHDDAHVTTAYDMALLTRYAMQNDTFRTIVGTGSYEVPASEWDSDGYQLENSNKLIHTKADATASFEYPYATGVKTGDTTQAGRCLVASAEKDGIELIVVLFGDIEGTVSGDYRYESAATLFDWGFENYASVTAAQLGLSGDVVLPVSNAAFDDAESGNLTLSADLSSSKIVGTDEDIEAITANPSLIISSYELNRPLSAPITQGETLGVITFSFEGNTLFSADLISTRDVYEIGAATETDDPNASPLLVDTPPDSSSGSNGWLFWVIIAVVLIAIVIAIRFAMTRRKRSRRSRRRRRSAYRVYR